MMDEQIKKWSDENEPLVPFYPLGELRFYTETGIDDRDWPSMRPELRNAILKGDTEKVKELRK